VLMLCHEVIGPKRAPDDVVAIHVVLSIRLLKCFAVLSSSLQHLYALAATI
jgi:hypothetical protein